MTKISSKPTFPLPLGATKVSPSCYRFSLFSSQATQITLVLADENFVIHEFVLSPKEHRTGDIWHIEVEGISSQWSYAFRVEGPNSPLSRFDSSKYIADPYAKNLHSPHLFGLEKTEKDYVFSHLLTESFSWENDSPLYLPKENMCIYEMHVRSFTKDISSQVKYPGTFLGIIEKIDYLKSLGINAIELLPIFEFDETHHPFKNAQFPSLCNYWGYSSINFFCPSRRYAYATDPCAPIREFKTLVKALHQAGIEIILDVVFNHTDEKTCSLPWIDFSSYYIVDSQGHLLNYSGCGNTLNTNQTYTKQLILDSLRYWVQEMHVDGFRFDLASVFSRDTTGSPSPYTAILQEIVTDPVLSKTKIIAEPWDASGLYQLGHFSRLDLRWSEWNGQYRDTIKDFLNGNPHRKGDFASKISGSQDLYAQGSPCNSINYICCHDGFTLRDTVSYNEKHNEANGENNQDGTNCNYSYNFGEEGDTQNSQILMLRQRQMRNFIITLYLSQGIPMLQSGDEYAHTAKGNNNRWSLDNEMNYFLWEELKKNQDFYDFVKQAILFRKQHHEVFNHGFLTQDNVNWLDNQAMPITWEPHHFLACELKGASYSVFIAFYNGNDQIEILLPKVRTEFLPYQQVVNTAYGFVEKKSLEREILEAHSTFVAVSYHQ